MLLSSAEKEIFAMSKPTREAAGRGQTLPWQVVAVILDWLEVRKNFDLVTGRAQSHLKGWKPEPS